MSTDTKKDLETVVLKIAIARTQTAIAAAERDLAAAEAAFLKAKARREAAIAENQKLIALAPGYREGCQADEAQNLVCPPEPAAKKEEVK